MAIKDIIQIAYTCVIIIVGATTTIIGFVRAAKAKKKAKTAEEQQRAQEMFEAEANKLMQKAEIFYKNLDIVLKQQGESAGPYKKEDVMAKLQDFAITSGLKFDKEKWSTYIDTACAFSKAVNVKVIE